MSKTQWSFFYLKEFSFFFLAAASLISVVLQLAHSPGCTLALANHLNRSQVVKKTIQLWKKGLILEVRQKASDSCPAPFKPLFEWEWPGVQPGCDCRLEYDYYEQSLLTVGQCSNQLLAQKCGHVSGVPPQINNRWRGNLLCAKVDPNYNYFNSSWVDCTNRCGEGEAAICMPFGWHCPLTSLSLNPFRPSYHGSHFLVQVNLTTDLLCQNKSNPFTYPLTRRFPDCQLSLASVIDQYPTQNFIQDNYNFSTATKTLPDFEPAWSTDPVFLAASWYPLWNYTCRINLTMSLQSLTQRTSYDPIKLTGPGLITLLIMSILVHTSILGRLLVTRGRLLILKRQKKCLLVKDSSFLKQPFAQHLQDRLTGPSLLILSTSRIVVLAFSVQVYFHEKNMVDWFIDSVSCSDQALLRKSLFDFSTIYRDCNSFTARILAAGAFGLAADLALLLWAFLFGSLRQSPRKVEQEPQTELQLSKEGILDLTQSAMSGSRNNKKDSDSARVGDSSAIQRGELLQADLIQL